jgi:hypothetical protein
MTDRVPLDHLTSDALDALYDRLEALQAVARGYCPECGRGDAGPTAEDWEQQRQRADRAEAALARVRALAEFTRNHVAPGRDDMSLAQHELACAILTALAEPGPAATQATEPGGWLHAGSRDLSIPQEPGPA